MASGCLSAIWQKKVPADVQGRVFAVRRMIAEFGRPISMLIAGPLADRVLEPGMAIGGSLVGVFGTGPSAGMAVLAGLSGLVEALAALVGYLIPAIRSVEDRLPDQEPIAHVSD